jgi:hypothetical protein
MIRTLSESTHIATKDYRCWACDWISNLLHEYEFTFAERRAIVKARKNGWRIKKGEKYIVQNNVQNGEFYSFKAIPAIHEICLKHDIYEEW